MLILLILLLLLFGGGFFGYNRYGRSGGLSVGGVVLIILLVWLFMGGGMGLRDVDAGCAKVLSGRLGRPINARDAIIKRLSGWRIAGSPGTHPQYDSPRVENSVPNLKRG